MPGELIITNGDVAGELLRRTLPGVEVLPWRDVLHEGPVPETATLEDLTEIRAQYLAETGAGPLDQLRADLQARDRGLIHSVNFDRVSLWFEHDLYDQLQLIQLLDWFNDHQRDQLMLVQASDFLGRQSEGGIRQLRGGQASVSEVQLALAKHAWGAFRSETPEAWNGLRGEDLSALPFLASAVARMLEMLPGPDGLSRTERQLLRSLRDGVVTPPGLFAAVQASEEAAFMGDLSFFHLLDGLALAEEPVLAGLDGAPLRLNGSGDAQAYFQSTLRLTPFGAEVADGAADFARRNSIDCWWGGTHLSNDALWRWNGSAEELIPPSR